MVFLVLPTGRVNPVVWRYEHGDLISNPMFQDMPADKKTVNILLTPTTGTGDGDAFNPFVGHFDFLRISQ